ncbi:MAG: diaminopimelate decarboxylase [Gammaproteobacteria bacterium]|nr:diaminopimelate decarboxylase [Gammaproteobacteria bacterium]
MRHDYREGRLHVDGTDLAEIAAAVGTPCYVYSRAMIEARWRAYDAGFSGRDHQIFYSVKANGNLSIIRLLSRLGAGFDIVSGGELERVLAAGARAEDVVFSGVGKTRDEIARAIEVGVACINVESRAELERISTAAKAFDRRASISVRVNPDIDPGTHPYISTGLRENKFGVPLGEVRDIYQAAADDPWLEPIGIASHIGSQLVSVGPVVDAARQIVELAEDLRAIGIELDHVDVGGGLGIRYSDERPPEIDAFVKAICAEIPAHYSVALEPGRSLVGEAGLLLTRVEYLKRTEAKNFVIVDAAMNDLIRPALYDAWHDILPVSEKSAGNEALVCDLVGPVCETGDWLARQRELNAAPGDLLAIMGTGAYGFVMTSNYNARLRPPEVLIDTDGFKIIRSRETVSGMLASEQDFLIS